MYCLPEKLPLFRKSYQSVHNYDSKRRESFGEVRLDRKRHALHKSEGSLLWARKPVKSAITFSEKDVITPKIMCC